MKSLKLLLFSVAAILTIPSFNIKAADGHHEKTLGILAGYDTRNNSGAAGIFFQYEAKRWLRIAPDLTYVTRRKGADALSLNLNLHFPVGLASRVNVYPLAGVSYTSWNFHSHGLGSLPDGDDVTERLNKFGLNLGGGLELKVKPTLKLRLEGQWTGARHASTGDITLGIGYVF